MPLQSNAHTVELIWMLGWISLPCGIFLAAPYHPKAQRFRDRMRTHWKPALAIAGLFALGMGLGGQGAFNLYALAVFCQALIGLTLATEIPGYQALPVMHRFIQRHQRLRQLGVMLGMALVIVVPAVVGGAIILNLGGQLFGETVVTSLATDALPPTPWQTFFVIFSGAGIAEETPYRLVMIPLVWIATRRPWSAVVLSALVFGAYHLSPLNSLAPIYWQFPITQLLSTTWSGLLLGYLLIKHGYETAVLGHTLMNWLPLLLFAHSR